MQRIIFRKEVKYMKAANMMEELMGKLLSQRLSMLHVGMEMIDGMLRTAYKNNAKDRRKDTLIYLPTLIELKKMAITEVKLIEDTLEERDCETMKKVWNQTKQTSEKVLALSNEILNK